MKTIKIFLASSGELEPERKEFADIVCNLNTSLEKMGFNVQLIKWEYLNSSMSCDRRKQDEYNAKLAESELCVVLFWTKLGQYTKEEFDAAYKALSSDSNPQKLYVFFKDSDRELEPALREFRDSFESRYGHFYCVFRNIDMLKADFLLQFMDYQSNYLQGSAVVEMRDSKVIVGGKDVVDLKNLAFVGNNEEYNLIVKSIKRCRKLLSVTEVDDPDYSETARELQDLLKRRQQLEESLWQTALTITRLSSTAMTDRLSRAIKLFNEGDSRGADAILVEDDILRDAAHNIRLIELGEEGRRGLENNIAELELKLKTVKANRLADWGDSVCNIHDKLIEFAEKCFGESQQLAEALNNAADDFRDLAKYDRSLALATRAAAIGQSFTGPARATLAYSLNKMGLVYSALRDLDHALEFYEKSLEIRQSVFGENHNHVAESYNNIGGVYFSQEDYPRALYYYEKALNIYNEDQDAIATCYNNIAAVYDSLGDYSLALEYYEKSLEIWKSMFGEVHSDVALSYGNIGIVYYYLEDYPTAMALYEKSLGIYLSIFGENHPAVAMIYNNIGLVYDIQGDYPRALDYYEKALKIYLKFLDEDHPNVVATKENILSLNGETASNQ